MSIRTRKLIGTILLLLFVAVYAVLVMALGSSRLLDMNGFVTLFRTQQFPFAMTLDFVACWVLGALLAGEEARVRQQPVLQWLGLVPVLGVPLVLALRQVRRP